MSTVSSLSDWFVTPKGDYVMAREQAFFDRAVTDVFGFNAVQLGLPQHNLLRDSRIPLHIRAGKEVGVQIWLESEELPFETSSIDLLLLPHVLEFSANPHQVLREVERVLRPEGSVIISGFNPFSLWGIRRVLGKKTDYPWRGKFISLPRIKDWMSLLGFEYESGKFACYAPPIAGSNFFIKPPCLEMASEKWWSVVGGVYFLHAVKRVPGVRLMKPKWKGRLVRNFIPASAKLNKEMIATNIRERKQE